MRRLAFISELQFVPRIGKADFLAERGEAQMARQPYGVMYM